MAYEYKSLILGERKECLYQSDVNELNNLYEEGWEYVDAVSQSTSISKGDGYGSPSTFGAVMVTVRREKATL